MASRHAGVVGAKKARALGFAVAAALVFPGAAVGYQGTGVQAVRRGLEGLVTAKGGPPGAIATLYRNGHLTVVSAGRADIEHSGAPRDTDHMRIASVSKAFAADRRLA